MNLEIADDDHCQTTGTRPLSLQSSATPETMTVPKRLEPIPPPTLAIEPPNPEPQGPLARYAGEEIKHLLRGFSDATTAGALGLREGSQIADFEACLYGILFFFRPAGSERQDELPSGQTRLREDLGLDSLAMMEAMFKIEELFDISIDNAELVETKTIADARCLLEEKLRLRNSA